MRSCITRPALLWPLLVAVYGLGCTSKPSDRPDTPAETSAAAAPSTAPRTLRRTLTTPQALEPARVVDVGGATVIGDLFEGLYRVGLGGQPILAAAERHDISPDGLTHTFTLREAGRWSDGSPVTAGDFTYAWLRALDPQSAAPGAAALYTIAGAKAYNGASEGPERDALRARVALEARDERTLVVRVKRPDPHLKWALTRPAAVPIPRAVVEAHGADWMSPAHITTNGMWTLVEHVPAQRITARGNPHYDDGHPAPFDVIEYAVVEDEAAAYNLYATDKLDYVAGKVPAAALSRLRRERSPDLRVVPFAGIDFYLFNTTRPPFDDAKVRQALSRAIDRSAIGSQVLKGGELPAESLIPPALGGRSEPVFDPERARALLTDAGYGPDKPLRRFLLSHDQSEPARRLAEYAQQQWKKNLGIDCDLLSMERKVLIGRQQALDYDVSRAAWFADVPAADEFLAPWRSDSRGNRTGWKSDAYDTATNALTDVFEPAARARAATAAESLLMHALPAMPTFVHVRSDLVKPRLLGHDPATGMYQPSRLFHFAD